MKSVEDESNKRRRTDPDGLNNIHCLPDAIIANVTTHLAKPSRAIFAVVTSPSAVGRLILSTSQWDVLDFAEIEEALASKLTDEDIAAILVSINAVNNVERLKLAGCINITGRGLEPIRGSKVIKQIDLSLVKEHESAGKYPQIKMCTQDVVPILDSIVDSPIESIVNLNSPTLLRHLQLPKEWRREHQGDEVLLSFLRKYNQHMHSNHFSCSRCNDPINTESWSYWIEPRPRRCFGLQNNKCYKCLEFFCDNCANDNGVDYLYFCHHCERDHCLDCCPNVYCHKCEKVYCEKCTHVEECDACEEDFCSFCALMEENKCQCWTESYCVDCAPGYTKCQQGGCTTTECENCSGEEDPKVSGCGECKTLFCSNCRYIECSKDYWNDCCAGCLQLIAHLIPKLGREIEKLRRENEQLKKTNRPC